MPVATPIECVSSNLAGRAAESARTRWCGRFAKELAERVGTAAEAGVLLAQAEFEVVWPAEGPGPLQAVLDGVLRRHVHNPDGMERLFAALEFQYGEPRWLTAHRQGYQAIRAERWGLLPAVAPGLLDAQERADLDTLLGDPGCPTEPGELCEVLWAAASSLGLPAARDGLLTAEQAGTVTALVEELDARNSPAGRVPPLLVFLEHLAARAEDVARADLRAWIDAVAQARADRVPTGRLAEERAAADAAASVSDTCHASLTSCLVRVEGSGPGAGRYRLAAWLYRRGRCLGIKVQDDTVYTAAEISGGAEELIARLQPYVQHLDPETLTFEFLLPWEALGWPVDEWNLRGGGQLAVARPIGRYGPVVVRSLDRLRDGWSTSQWTARWERLDGRSAADDPPPRACWLDGDGTPADEADDRSESDCRPLVADMASPQALAAEVASRKDISCLILTYPYPHLATTVPDALLSAIQEGVPAAVWWRGHRDGSVPPGRARRVAELAEAGAGLSGLPATVLTLRQEAARCAKGSHDGTGIAVLWDNPGWHPERLRRLGGPRAHRGGNG
ncbi:VMAP-C domain-containing protein [Streptomyces coffeae]|uniref:Uncharacterized protein n=1 Tax=Streptomyces coffeae TaxID=621382 RepID=A0ABS1NKQ5_9ACTN|nr:hypothetical protein [Streptomyces coffeae]MBL1100684.1 hypothetical protein [Streptomyces coffeae]